MVSRFVLKLLRQVSYNPYAMAVLALSVANLPSGFSAECAGHLPESPHSDWLEF